MPVSVNIAAGSEQHARICESLRQRHRASAKIRDERSKVWEQNEQLMVGYMPSDDADRIRTGRRENGSPQYTTIQLPYSYAIMMAAHSYWCTTFLSRTPVFQFEGFTGEGEMQVQALEALVNYQVHRGKMLAPLYIWLQDVPKYGEAWLSPYWTQQKIRTSEIVETQDMVLGMLPIGPKRKVNRVTEVMGYEGNMAFNVSPQDVYTDPRFARGRFQEGEFLFIATTASMGDLLRGKAEGRYINLEELRKRAPQGTAENSGEDWYANHNANTELTQRAEPNDFTTANSMDALNVFKVYESYVTLVPKDWKLGSGDMPEKWVFTITRDFRTIVEARPMGNFHDQFPLAYLEVEPEAYAKFSRSMIETYGPLQQTIDWLFNSHMFNVRQSLNNQWLLDPSRVETKDLSNKGMPGLAIRLKPAAYGSDVRTALMQLPVADVTGNNMNDLNSVLQFGERLGVSESIMGMSHPSSRRSAQEVRGTQTFSVSRLKTMAEYMSATGFSRLSDMLVMNSQQYYSGDMKFKLAGDLAQMAGGGFVNVTPQDIVGQYGFGAVDGTLPVDRFAMANMWRETLAQMAQVPQVIQKYDLGKLFAYMAQLGGIKNLSRFEIQLVPDMMMQAQAAAGNSVPLGDDPAALQAGVMEPGQVPGVGPTA